MWTVNLLFCEGPRIRHIGTERGRTNPVRTTPSPPFVSHGRAIRTLNAPSL